MKPFVQQLTNFSVFITIFKINLNYICVKYVWNKCNNCIAILYQNLTRINSQLKNLLKDYNL